MNESKGVVGFVREEEFVSPLRPLNLPTLTDYFPGETTYPIISGDAIACAIPLVLQYNANNAKSVRLSPTTYISTSDK